MRIGDALLAPAGVTGIQSVARTYCDTGGTGSVLVHFTPEGAACLGVPASELTGRSVLLDAIVSAARVAEVLGRLCAARGSPARVAIVEQFLVELPCTSDPVVARAVALLGAQNPDTRVAAVARALG